MRRRQRRHRRRGGSRSAALLPDVILRPITEVRIEKRVGVKLLRFASIIGNGGAGVVELKPDSPSRSATTTATATAILQ